MLPLSVFIICKDEVGRIGHVLEAVKNLSEDIVVVDSGSTDGTPELAKKYTKRVYHRDWTGFGDQKVFAEGLCRHNWILNLDADEVPSKHLREEIIQLITADPENALGASGFELRVTMMASLDESYPRFLAPYNFTGRLYDKRFAGFSSNPVHDKLTEHASGKIRFPRLRGHIYHYSIKSYTHMWRKIGSYSELQAKDWISKGRKPKLWMAFFEAPLFFLKHYFLRRLFALGVRGFVIALSLTAGRVLRRVIVADMTKNTVNFNPKNER